MRKGRAHRAGNHLAWTSHEPPLRSVGGGGVGGVKVAPCTFSSATARFQGTPSCGNGLGTDGWPAGNAAIHCRLRAQHAGGDGGKLFTDASRPWWWGREDLIGGSDKIVHQHLGDDPVRTGAGIGTHDSRCLSLHRAAPCCRPGHRHHSYICRLCNSAGRPLWAGLVLIIIPAN
jgi:hypothetical protein